MSRLNLDSTDSDFDDWASGQSVNHCHPAHSDSESSSSAESNPEEIPCGTKRSRKYYADGSIRSLQMAVGMLYMTIGDNLINFRSVHFIH
jgi:hypothetical protein